MVSVTRRYKVPKVNELLDMATCLDSRFKLDFTPEQDVANVRAHLQGEAEVLLDEYVEGSVEQGQKTQILQRKSLHLRRRESLWKFCRKTEMLSLLKTGLLE